VKMYSKMPVNALKQVVSSFGCPVKEAAGKSSEKGKPQLNVFFSLIHTGTKYVQLAATILRLVCLVYLLVSVRSGSP
jgi:hypothetical protein